VRDPCRGRDAFVKGEGLLCGKGEKGEFINIFEGRQKEAGPEKTASYIEKKSFGGWRIDGKRNQEVQGVYRRKKKRFAQSLESLKIGKDQYGSYELWKKKKKSGVCRNSPPIKKKRRYAHKRRTVPEREGGTKKVPKPVTEKSVGKRTDKMGGGGLVGSRSKSRSGGN